MSMPNADAAKGLGDVAVMATQITLDRLGDRMTARIAKPQRSQWL